MASLKKVKVVLLASEWSSKHGGISTFNRVLAIQLAQNPKVAVSVFLPECDQTEREEAKKNNITLVQAELRPGFDKMQLLCHPPKDLEIDFVIGHGVVLGCQAQIITDNRSCKWVQFVHTDPEELGMFKDYADVLSKGEEKHLTEVKLCEMADFVVAVGPKLAEIYRSYLRHCGKDRDVFELTPGIFSEFSNVLQSTLERRTFRVLSFGPGDAEDYHLKGFDIAAKAVANLHNAYLIFVGASSKEQYELAERSKECNLPPSRLRVRAYKDKREGLKQLFTEVDLAIMPSRTEGFGLAALEALSAGLPVLVSANSGFGEALDKVPFGPGCVISSEDAGVWAEEIGKVMKKPRVIRLRESKSVLERYAKKYNWQEQTNDLVEKIVAIREGRQFSCYFVTSFIYAIICQLHFTHLLP